MTVYANWMTPLASFLPKTAERGRSASAMPCSSMSESSCRAAFIRRTTISNCWCSSSTWSMKNT